jgi:predicted unusual protein kinase regulating ubiquinone biosynthesis (AarF/ABC1/UbiB family)
MLSQRFFMDKDLTTTNQINTTRVNSATSDGEPYAQLLFNRRTNLTGTVIRGRRREQIVTKVLTLALRVLAMNIGWAVFGSNESSRSVDRRKNAIWLRNAILELGPTFVKGGQLASTRADLFAQEYIDELSLLQDKTKPFPYKEVEAAFLREFGKKPNEVFKEFSVEPIASASLGQVHQAVTWSDEKVVVKIQRPNLESELITDLFLIRDTVEFFQKTGLGQGREWLAICDEYSRVILSEIDYISEGINANRFRRNFSDVPEVIVPKVYWGQTRRTIIAYEAIYGVKIDNFLGLDALGVDRRKVAANGVNMFLKMLLVDYFFHADPHPGNLAVTAQGAIVLYDFGMVGELPRHISARFSYFLAGIAQRDPKRIISALIEIGLLDPSGDLEPIKRTIEQLLSNLLSGSVLDESLDSLIDDILLVARQQTIRIPANFAFVLRALGTLESVGRRLDPTFDFNETVAPFVLPLVGETVAALNPIETGLVELERAREKIFNLPERLDRSLDRLEKGNILNETASEALVSKQFARMQSTLVGMALVVGLTLSSTLLFLNDRPLMGIGSSVIALLPLWIVIKSLLGKQSAR